MSADELEQRIDDNEYTLFDKFLYGGFGYGYFCLPTNIFRVILTVIFPPLGVILKYLDDEFPYVNLKKLVGFEKFKIDNSNFIERPKNSFLDFNAIAKGYTVDLISHFFDTNNIDNYLVEIGGEIRVKGINLSNNSSWIIGINEPRYDNSQDIFSTTELNNSAMATSGIYRKYKIDSNGRRYAHILDPVTGLPTKTNILSVSVISESCMIADAYATALHLMNMNEIEYFLSKNNDVSAYIIYENEKMEITGKTYNNFIIR